MVFLLKFLQSPLRSAPPLCVYSGSEQHGADVPALSISSDLKTFDFQIPALSHCAQRLMALIGSMHTAQSIRISS